MIPTIKMSQEARRSMSFQSRNRETYDSNEAWQTQPDQAVAGFNLVIEKLMIPTGLNDNESRVEWLFQSRNRETYDSNLISNAIPV